MKSVSRDAKISVYNDETATGVGDWGAGMKIEQLRCFAAVEEYRNFSRAAESLYISQSSISKQLKSLEEELNVSLFRRNTKSVELTEAGLRILKQVKNLIRDYDGILTALEEYTSEGTHKIRICAMCDMSQYGVTDIIIAFEKKYDATAEINERDHQSMLNCLDTRASDLAIGYLELWPRSDDFIAYPLRKDSLVLVMNRNHPLSGRENIGLDEMAGEKFCFPREDSTMFQFYIEQCQKAGFSPELTFSNVRLSTIRHYVAQGLRVTILTRKRAEELFNAPEYAIIPIKDSPELTLSIYTRNEHIPVICSKFIKFTEGFFDRPD